MILNAFHNPDIDSETARLLIEMCDRLLAPLIAAAIVCIGRILLNI